MNFRPSKGLPTAFSKGGELVQNGVVCLQRLLHGGRDDLFAPFELQCAAFAAGAFEGMISSIPISVAFSRNHSKRSMCLGGHGHRQAAGALAVPVRAADDLHFAALGVGIGDAAMK